MKEKIINPENPSVLSVPCLLCGSFTELTEREAALALHGSHVVKVCRDCRSAVAYAKEQMKNSR